MVNGSLFGAARDGEKGGHALLLDFCESFLLILLSKNYVLKLGSKIY